MKDYTNYPKAECCNSLKNSPVASKSLFDFHFSFGIASAVYLLISILAVICQSYSITNGTVSNEMVNVCAPFAPLY